jgi:hypothetical protein
MIAVLLIVIGVGLIALGFPARRRANEAAKRRMLWPTAQGRVVTAQLATRETEGGENSTSYRVLDVRYQYEVAGAEHLGARDFTADKTLPERQSRYVEGAAVAVYYDPDHPAKSVIEPTAKATSSVALLCWIFGAIALLIGMFVMLPAGKTG